ncbi:hypothetical protein C1N60_08835 [Pantoea sp. SGAir0184]
MKKLTSEKCQSVIAGFKWLTDEGIGMSIRDGYDLQAYEIALQALKQPTAQFFIVEHDSGYEVETTLHAAMERRADFGGRIWALTGSIMKPKTDTYRQIENDDWIEWGGGSVAPVTGLVEVRWSTGSTDIGDAGVWRWEHSKFMVNLVAYRVIENDGREG